MIDAIVRDLHQPEYLHVLLNPIPVYGLAAGLIALIAALFLRSRPAQIVGFIIILLSSSAAWPVYEFGEQGYDRVMTMADDDGKAWLNAHQDRAEDLIWFFYALAALSLVAIVAPAKWPRSSAPLVVAVILLAAITLGVGGYIAYAGGKIRHREFRNGPPPKQTEAEQH